LKAAAAIVYFVSGCIAEWEKWDDGGAVMAVEVERFCVDRFGI
jgi:hypothetical protein